MSENITVELDLDDSKFTSKIKQSTKSLKDFESALKSVATSHRKMADAAQASAGRLGSLGVTLSRVNSDVQKLNSSLQRSLYLQRNVVASFSSSANTLLTINRSIETSFSRQAKAVADFNRMTIAARKSERSFSISATRGKKVGSPLKRRENSVSAKHDGTDPFNSAIVSIDSSIGLLNNMQRYSVGDASQSGHIDAKLGGISGPGKGQLPALIGGIGLLGRRFNLPARIISTLSGISGAFDDPSREAFQGLVKDAQPFKTISQAELFVDQLEKRLPSIEDNIRKKETLISNQFSVVSELRGKYKENPERFKEHLDLQTERLGDHIVGLEHFIDQRNAIYEAKSFIDAYRQDKEKSYQSQYLNEVNDKLFADIYGARNIAKDQLSNLRAEFQNKSADYTSRGKDLSSIQPNKDHAALNVILEFKESVLEFAQQASANERRKLNADRNEDIPLSDLEKQAIQVAISELDNLIESRTADIKDIRERLAQFEASPSTPPVPANADAAPKSYTRPRTPANYRRPVTPSGVPAVPRNRQPEPEEPPKTPFQRQMQEWANIGQNFNQAMTGWLDSSVDALANFITTGKADFSGLINSMIKDITKLALKWTMSKVMSGLGGDKGASSGKAATAKTGSKGVPIPTPKPFPLAHTGGIIGASNLVRRSINPAAFVGAPRFHTGGIIKGLGLGPGEVPIIAKKGEGVFTPEQMKALGGVANSNVSQLNPVSINNEITVNGSGGTPEQNQDLAKKMSRELESSMRQTVIKELRNQQRPGGIIAA
ncbi:MULTISPECIES: phage tail tape measure C-terminal domain-containing protein [unclassified Pseudovibrio]|uniref:phage tail tape measure C-terminal domain-containing protein n=1 Tax=unclassified Pseudovibrio TaxID=2627060 RepID=UPI0007AE8381|nr:MULTISPECIES: phage tail tape measure C-terminal domain-containing protein [unclassified Pseudovibrio]KZK92565.1 Lambda phage tail tape-measure protein [Pseudovibrio sp. W74]KZL10391.1 Lambda phage tail tape-measure protein [Pseudovibrio sp. Ad14]